MQSVTLKQKVTCGWSTPMPFIFISRHMHPSLVIHPKRHCNISKTNKQTRVSLNGNPYSASFRNRMKISAQQSKQSIVQNFRLINQPLERSEIPVSFSENPSWIIILFRLVKMKGQLIQKGKLFSFGIFFLNKGKELSLRNSSFVFFFFSSQARLGEFNHQRILFSMYASSS